MFPLMSGYFARYFDKVDWEAGEEARRLIAEPQCKQLAETALIMTECRGRVRSRGKCERSQGRYLCSSSTSTCLVSKLETAEAESAIAATYKTILKGNDECGTELNGAKWWGGRGAWQVELVGRDGAMCVRRFSVI